jgi:hypothetical protein
VNIWRSLPSESGDSDVPQITEAKPTAGLYAPENRLNEHEAAKYLKRPVSTLRHWRVKGGGPDYLKVGRRIEYLIPAALILDR